MYSFLVFPLILSVNKGCPCLFASIVFSVSISLKNWSTNIQSKIQIVTFCQRNILLKSPCFEILKELKNFFLKILSTFAINYEC